MAELDVCIETYALGYTCNYNSNCSETSGSYCPGSPSTSKCLIDYSLTCSNDDQCANNMFCNYEGICSCSTGLGEPNSSRLNII